MHRFVLPASLAATALLLMHMTNVDDAPFVAAVVLLSMMGLALALLYDPALEPLVRLRRGPMWRDAGLVLLCLPMVLTTFGAVELLLFVLKPRALAVDQPLAESIEGVLSLLVLLAPLALVLAVGVAPRHPTGTRPPLWPLVAALAGCVFAWIGGSIAWLGTGRPLVAGSATALAAAVSSPAVLATAALPLGIGLQFWLRAVSHRGAERFPNAGMFGQVVVGVIAGTLIGVAIIGALVLPLSPGTRGLKAPVLAGWLTMVIAAVWLWTLWRVRHIVPANGLGAVAAVALLFVVNPLSYAPAMLLADTGDWAPLFLLLCLPVTLAACAFVWLVVPRLLDWLINPPSSVPSASAGPAR